MSEIGSLFDLVASIGFEAVDPEIEAWIAMGEFDESVKERARAMGWLPPDSKYSDLDKDTLF